MDTQQLRTESSLEMSVVTIAITAAITGLTPLKSKPVQAIIMSISWFHQCSVQHTVQVIIFSLGLFLGIFIVFVSVSSSVFKDEEYVNVL